MSGTVFFGQLVDCKSFDELNIVPDGFLAVDIEGKICGIGSHDRYAQWTHPEKNQFTVRQLGPREFMLPGLIDCHIHAPQMPNIGLGLDKPLLEWLDAYTFPLEANYSDAEFARRIYSRVVRHCLRAGTTTACYFATIHRAASEVLVDEAISQGQRAFIGKVSMDQQSPDFYVESLEQSLADNEAFIQYVLAKKCSRVQPVITPRFAITCSETLMNRLAEMAARYNLLIQSHMSENIGEIEFVRELYPAAANYADVYRRHGLLTGRTIMAHCVHIDNDELATFNQCGTAAIHCPTSNTYLSSGLCDVKRIKDKNVKVGLGTDISGGNRVGIFDVIRHSLEVSQALKFVNTQEIKGTGRMPNANQDYVPMNFKNALYLATAGGAEALCISDKVGTFQIGKEFDALLINTAVEPIIEYDLTGTKVEKTNPAGTLLSLVEKFIYVGDDRNIAEVYVQGKKVK